MAFLVAQKTLERLEWPQVMTRLQRHCRTPQAHARLAPVEPDRDTDEAADHDVFADTEVAVRERLAQTSEARQLLDAQESPPLGGVARLDDSIRRAGKGGALSAMQILEVGSSLRALHATQRFLQRRADRAPRLEALAVGIEDQPELARTIEASIDDAGAVRDGASRALADARRDGARLSGELQSRLARYLQNPDIKRSLSDSYYTVRNDRYVLPVRSDARSRIRGIVHDASNSGTTVFIEPEGAVELNNRLKQAELTVTREELRVLRDLSARIAAALPQLESGLRALEQVDLAFARAHLSQEMEAVAPEVARDGRFDLAQLRHPLLPPEEAVANDLRVGSDFTVLVLSGPNAGGKTVAMKAVALAALFVRAGLHVPAEPGARVALVDAILADIGDDQDIRESLSTFSAHMVKLAHIVKASTAHTLVVLDEVGVGTDPSEGASLAQAVLERLADSDARVIATTHYNLLKEMAEVDERFCNASVEFDPETLAPTYRVHLGAPGSSSATAVAARMGMPSAVLDRANQLLDREDRRLDRMLAELATSRATLEHEQREVTRLRAESEATRDQYRAKLERLQERRDKLFDAMRTDLDSAFRDAHAQVAGVIRDLQRGGTAQDAAHARTRLQTLETRTRAAEEEAGLRDSAAPDAPPARPVDWRRARPGDAVAVPAGQTGTLESLPDRRGRVTVRVGSARLVLPAERVQAAGAGAEQPHSPSAQRRPSDGASATETGLAPDAMQAGGTLRCDLRGMRVLEALDAADEAIDRASAEGRLAALFIHGHGTGALRKAVREHLAKSPLVEKLRPGDREEGGDGVTFAMLR